MRLVVCAVLVASAALSGCVQDRLARCGDGVTCPLGMVCVEDTFCATTEQLAACNGLVESDPCSSESVVGFCVKGACRSSICGNGVVEYGEICDDGNDIATDGCTNSCVPEMCGDGIVASDEDCDDPSQATNCPYGVASCMICDATCHFVDATGNVCGDGVVAAPDEVCDDGNTDACGTCDATCRVFASSAATGSIIAVAGTNLEGKTFTLNDGRHAQTIFEFDTNASVTAGNVAVTITAVSTADQVATAMIGAINGVGGNLDIQAATGGGALVTLVDQVKTVLANKPIAKTVADVDFVVVGMSGGAGGNCANGMGCVTADDCTSHSCNAAHMCGP
ncbi:MAG: DUF4215 domain-containing protein [Kofleriaceae bacterium]